MPVFIRHWMRKNTMKDTVIKLVGIFFFVSLLPVVVLTIPLVGFAGFNTEIFLLYCNLGFWTGFSFLPAPIIYALLKRKVSATWIPGLSYFATIIFIGLLFLNHAFRSEGLVPDFLKLSALLLFANAPGIFTLLEKRSTPRMLFAIALPTIGLVAYAYFLLAV